jgi:large subunit ribosomal protein L13
MEKTYITKNHTPLDKKWYLIDATNLTLGRLASQVGQMLMGKDKSSYSPHQDLGDYVIVINAEKINVTGKKERQKIYRSHSGRPGGMKIATLQVMREKKPEQIIEHAVKGMLPKNKLGRKLVTKLKVYRGENHPHIAQNPQLIENYESK